MGCGGKTDKSNVMVGSGKSNMSKQLDKHDSEDKKDEEQQVGSIIKAYKESIIHTWIKLKEGINGISCFEKYFGKQRLKRENFPALRSRSLLEINEKFLLSVYHIIENVDDIEFFESCVGENLVKMLHNPNRGAGANKQSDLFLEENKSEFKISIQRNKEEMKKMLRPEDIAFTKDYFLQSQIIGIDENEELFKMMERSEYNKVLENLTDTIIKKLDEGSFECFLSCLQDIVYEQNRQRPKSLIDSLTSKLPVRAIQFLTSLRPVQYKLYKTDSGSLQNVEIHAHLRDTNGTDMSAVHERLKDSQDCLNKVLVPNCGLTVSETDNGSVIIKTRSLGILTELQLDRCLRTGKFASVIEMLFNDVELVDCISPGRYTLNVTIRSTNKEKSYIYSRNASRPLDAITDNMKFLVNEMDTELIITGFKRHNVTVFEFDSNIERKKLAHQIITHVNGKSEFKETFRQILQEERLEYMLNRLNMYEEIYKLDRNHLQKNIFVMFPVLADQVDLDEVKNTFVERNVLNESVFNEMEKRYGSRRDLAMASLLVKILTSADMTLPTFVDALYTTHLQSLARTIINKEPQIDISKRTDEFAIEMVDKTTGEIMFEGSFELTIKTKDKDFSVTTIAATKPTLKFEEDLRQPPIKRPPSPVEQSFRDDVNAWKKIRKETIPRLERLERELRSANENIKTARTVRNWTIGLSVLGGLLFAPLTGGGSLAAAAAVAGGTTGVLYIIEMYIEKDVLETTQEGINKDKAETLRLRTRITSYQGGHKRTEEFVHDLGDIAFEAIFILSQDPLVKFIASFVDNNSMSLLKAIEKVIDLREQLDKELRRVEEVEGRFD